MSNSATPCENMERNNKLYKNMRLSEMSLLASIKTGLAAEVRRERRARL
jgi:hypothetical protein